MSRWHTTLPQRFGSFPKHKQLLMVANELNRADHLTDDPREYRNCLERALELMDLLTEDRRWLPALRELRRARELLAALYILAEPAGLQTHIRTLIQLDPVAWKMLSAGY